MAFSKKSTAPASKADDIGAHAWSNKRLHASDASLQLALEVSMPGCKFFRATVANCI